MHANQPPTHLKKRMLIMLTFLAIIFGAIFSWKWIGNTMMKRYMASQQIIVYVSATPIKYALWESKLQAIGNVRAIRGVNVTSSLPGIVQRIYFKPGALAKQNELLVQINIDAEMGKLNSLKASAELANITFERDKKQYAFKAISKQVVDTDAANLKNLLAQIAEQEAIIAKKTIRAPFDGRLGISYISPGQYINPGDKLVPLQMLDPIYVDFNVPQQQLAELKLNQSIQLKSDSFPTLTFSGIITTIDSQIDMTTRNIAVEGTIANPKYLLTPGMFVDLNVITGPPKQFLTLPITAISFNPYGEMVYVIKQMGKDDKEKPILIANQVFVVTGEKRGDQITILKGLKEGEMIVTSGQLKLKNGDRVVISNVVVPR